MQHFLSGRDNSTGVSMGQSYKSRNSGAVPMMDQAIQLSLMKHKQNGLCFNLAALMRFAIEILFA